MKIPYYEMKCILIIVFCLLMCASGVEKWLAPNPMLVPYVPSFLWELGGAILLTTSNWPTALPIWILGIAYLLSVWRTPSIKSETKDETIARLREVNKDLSRELTYANFRIDEKVKKLVYLEAILESKRCSKCLEPLEE